LDAITYQPRQYSGPGEIHNRLRLTWFSVGSH